MYLFICSIDPKVGLIELFVVGNEHQITACWMPKRYPDRARIQKIVKGRPLDKAEFVLLASTIPSILSDLVCGKTIQELRALVGKSIAVEDLHIEFEPKTP